MNIARPFFDLYFSFYLKEIERFIEKPIETQEKVFRYLIENGRNSLYGQEHGFEAIRTQDDFRKRVPVIRYEELKPYVEKIILENQPNVLWSKPVKWFAMSSGTTKDRSKYIPVTQESLIDSHYKCGKQLLGLYLRDYPESKFFWGKTMVLGGSRQVNAIGGDMFTGDVSAILMKHLPWWAKSRRTPESIALIPDWESKFEKLVDWAVKADVRSMMGVPSWMLILIEKIVERTGKRMKDVWPNIDVFFHGGINFTPYESQYKRLFEGAGIHFWETYNASEGFFGIQYSAKKKDLLLMLDNNIFYEFMPMGELEKENPQTLLLDEVQTGKHYALIISTNGGLWRYMIGDTIEFTSTSPFLFKITGRTTHYINAFGEELVVENADNAIRGASERTGSSVSEYTAAPVFFKDRTGGVHEWLIEFETPPADLDAFAEILDEELKKVNSDYEAKRSYNLSLQRPVVYALPTGTFYNWMKSQNKLGGQNKIPRLANDSKYIERIKEFSSLSASSSAL
jgi:Coenzyme F390 synthetase